MIIKIIFITSIFCFVLSEKDIYLPMDHESKYGEDVCAYTDDGVRYVKPCKKGQYCVDDVTNNNYLSDTSMLEICQDIPKVTVLYNPNEGKCTTSFECESGLTCIGGKCEKDCPDGFFSMGYYGNYNCKENTEKGTGFCESKTISTTAANPITQKYSYPEIYKRCGKLTIAEDPRTGHSGEYYIQLNEYDYIGTVEDGGYVNDEKLCESGFALDFYYDGKSEDSNGNIMYKRCITPLSISKINTGDCTISYKIKDGDVLNYNSEQSSSSSSSLCSESFIKIKSEMFRKYSQTIKEDERKTCGDLDGINKYTCENNELIKLWFFYKHPQDYIVYNEREKLSKVLDYKIQKEYPNYSFSQYLNIKFLFLLYLLFF